MHTTTFQRGRESSEQPLERYCRASVEIIVTRDLRNERPDVMAIRLYLGRCLVKADNKNETKGNVEELVRVHIQPGEL